MAPPKPRYIDQNFINGLIPPIQVLTLTHNELKDAILSDFLAQSPPSIGIAWGSRPESASLAVLAIATATQVLLISLGGRTRAANLAAGVVAASAGQELLQQHVLLGTDRHIFAFDLAPLALVLYSQFRLHIQNGIDIQDCLGGKDRSPLYALQQAVGEDVPIYPNSITSAFESLDYDAKDKNTIHATALRAWAAQYIGALDGVQDLVYKARKIDTTKLTAQVSYSHDEAIDVF